MARIDTDSESMGDASGTRTTRKPYPTDRARPFTAADGSSLFCVELPGPFFSLRLCASLFRHAVSAPFITATSFVGTDSRKSAARAGWVLQKSAQLLLATPLKSSENR